MQVSIVDLDMALKLGRELSFFHRTADELFGPKTKHAFANSRDTTIACLRWIWASWLSGVPTSELTPTIEKFVDRALSLIETCSFERERGLSDLYLLYCAIMESPHKQLAEVASVVVDFNDSTPGIDDGERYARTWTGVLKHRLLRNFDKMQSQANAMAQAVKPINCRRAPRWIHG